MTLAVSVATVAAENADGVVVSGSESDTVLTGLLADSGEDAALTVFIDDGTASASQLVVLDIHPDVGLPPADLELTGAMVAEDAAVGAVIAVGGRSRGRHADLRGHQSNLAAIG